MPFIESRKRDAGSPAGDVSAGGGTESAAVAQQDFAARLEGIATEDGLILENRPAANYAFATTKVFTAGIGEDSQVFGRIVILAEPGVGGNPQAEVMVYGEQEGVYSLGLAGVIPGCQEMLYLENANFPDKTVLFGDLVVFDKNRIRKKIDTDLRIGKAAGCGEQDTVLVVTAKILMAGIDIQTHLVQLGGELEDLFDPQTGQLKLSHTSEPAAATGSQETPAISAENLAQVNLALAAIGAQPLSSEDWQTRICFPPIDSAQSDKLPPAIGFIMAVADHPSDIDTRGHLETISAQGSTATIKLSGVFPTRDDDPYLYIQYKQLGGSGVAITKLFTGRKIDGRYVNCDQPEHPSTDLPVRQISTLGQVALNTGAFLIVARRPDGRVVLNTVNLPIANAQKNRIETPTAAPLKEVASAEDFLKIVAQRLRPANITEGLVRAFNLHRPQVSIIGPGLEELPVVTLSLVGLSDAAAVSVRALSEATVLDLAHLSEACDSGAITLPPIRKDEGGRPYIDGAALTDKRLVSMPSERVYLDGGMIICLYLTVDGLRVYVTSLDVQPTGWKKLFDQSGRLITDETPPPVGPATTTSAATITAMFEDDGGVGSAVAGGTVRPSEREAATPLPPQPQPTVSSRRPVVDWSKLPPARFIGNIEPQPEGADGRTGLKDTLAAKKDRFTAPIFPPRPRTEIRETSRWPIKVPSKAAPYLPAPEVRPRFTSSAARHAAQNRRLKEKQKARQGKKKK